MNEDESPYVVPRDKLESSFGSIVASDIICAEFPGRMGNESTLYIYTVNDDTLSRYELDVELLYIEANNLIVDNGALFNFWYGGYGACFCINKSAIYTVDTKKKCFVFSSENNQYEIYPSSQGVFAATTNSIKEETRNSPKYIQP